MSDRHPGQAFFISTGTVSGWPAGTKTIPFLPAASHVLPEKSLPGHQM